MADRLAGIYGKEAVGIYHGKSLINKMMLCEDEDDEYKEIKDQNFQSKNFMNPVCVTTVDHVLYSLIHAYKTSDFACGGLQTSVIVFDEIHYYEKTTMEYIYEALRILREMKIPHILMSATLPEFIIKDIKDQYHYIYDNEGMSYKPFIIKRINECLITKLDGEWNINQWFIKELIKNYKFGMRQTIIVNTVDKAQQFYESIICLKEISQGDVLLFHGRFTVNDRIRKEHEIFCKSGKYPFILIATQIIEISVDVSCNIMFTELAPFDALAQRGGRLNRKGTDHIVNGVNQTMYVFDIENTRPYAKNTGDEAFKYLYNSWASIPDAPISYEEIKNIVDDIYKDEKLLQTEYTGLFLQSSLFGNTPEDVRGSRVDEDTGGYFCTRHSDFKQIDVIPSIKIPECVNNITSASNIIKIPQYLLFQFPEMFYNQEINGQMYRVCKFKYTYEKGIESGIEDKSGYFEWE